MANNVNKLPDACKPCIYNVNGKCDNLAYCEGTVFSTTASGTGAASNNTYYSPVCPHCGSFEYERADSFIYTSNPPCYKYRCKKCGSEFFLQTQFIDSHSDNRQGWICPRCGKVWSPDVKNCDCQSDNCDEKLATSGQKFNLNP